MSGGALGASVRWALTQHHATTDIPWYLLGVNIAGCALLALILAAGRLDEQWRIALGAGFCGGLTTFSTFALDVARFFDDGRAGIGLAYLALTVCGGAAAFTGVRVWSGR